MKETFIEEMGIDDKYKEEKLIILSAIEIAKSFNKKYLIVEISNSNLEELTKDLSENGYTVYVNLVCYLDDRSSVTITWE